MTMTTVVLAGHLLGVNIRLQEAAEIPQIAEAGFGAVRTDLFWHDVEREKGRYDFSAYDGLLASLKRHRLTPVLILDYGNPHYDGGDAPRTDDARAAFARFASAAASRYAGQGVIWEVWNEPDVRWAWRPAPSPEDYVRLVRAASAAIKAADRGAVVAGPAVGGCEWDREFLRRTFALGLLDHLDAVSVHPYPAPTPEEAQAFYGELTEMVDRHAPGRRLPLLCTELGILTHDEPRHRDHLVRMVMANVRSGLALTVWYSWRDDDEGHYGFVDAAGRRKAAYYTVRSLAQLGNATVDDREAGPSRRAVARAPGHDVCQVLRSRISRAASSLAPSSASVPRSPGR
jgi:hypothetical protein